MEDLEICMRCGFCRASCPIFDETLSESDTARGKIAIIHAMNQGKLKPSKSVAKKINECVLCGRCSHNCPAGVDTTKILVDARKELVKSFLPSRKRAAFNILERPRALRYLKTASGLLPDNFNFSPQKVAKAEYNTIKAPRMKVAFFGGCMSNYLLPDIREACVEVLAKNKIETVSISENCCGVPLYFSGAVDRAKKIAEKNLKSLNPTDVDAIITPCPTCKIGLTRYPEIVESGVKAKAEDLANKTFEICEFLEENGYDKPEGVLNRSYTYHVPCHSNFGLENREVSRKFVKGVHGMKLREMENPDACCGFGGLFSIENPDISEKIKLKKIRDITSTKSEEVITPCPGCALYISEGLKKEDSKIAVKHPIQVLREAYKNQSSD
jgi:glycolate oxidase iron-sulfur subunit